MMLGFQKNDSKRDMTSGLYNFKFQTKIIEMKSTKTNTSLIEGQF